MQIISIRATSAALAILGLAACGARTATIESAGEVAASTEVVTPIDNRTLPVGATLTATLDQALGTATNKAGDTFTATVTSDLRAQNTTVVVPAGAKIHGRVTATDDSDNATDAALIRLAFDRISFGGRSYPFSANIIRSEPVQSSSQSSSDRTRNIVIGGAVGAAIGAILGDRDLDKIVIGGAIGAAAGSIISLGTEMNATLPAGSYMTLRSTQMVALR